MAKQIFLVSIVDGENRRREKSAVIHQGGTLLLDIQLSACPRSSSRAATKNAANSARNRRIRAKCKEKRREKQAMSSFYRPFQKVAGLCRLTIGLLCTQSQLAPLSHKYSNIQTS